MHPGSWSSLCRCVCGCLASECGLALPAWACFGPHTSSRSTLYSRHRTFPVGGQGGPCMSSVSSPCCAALFPQGKFRTLIAVSNQTALCTETNPWPRGRGQAKILLHTSLPFSCLPSPLGHCILYFGPSAFLHWALDFSIDLSLAVPGPGVSTSQEEKREAGSPARSYASFSYGVGTLSTSPR